VVERVPGVFYVRRNPFLHFHLIKGLTRRADIKGSEGWLSVDLPRPLPPAAREVFVQALKARYGERRPLDSR